MDDPDYGTIMPDLLLPVSVGEGASARVLVARTTFDQKSPFQTKQVVQMIAHFTTLLITSDIFFLILPDIMKI
jgi:hypothetical protein